MKSNISKEIQKELLFTWLKRLGEQYETSFVVTDPALPDNPLVFVNDAFIRLSGYRQEELLGRNCRFLQGKETKKETILTIQELLKDEISVHTEILNYRKDGMPFWNELVIQPLRDDFGRLLFYVGLQLDVTHRKQTESLFLVQQEMYEGIERGYTIASLLQRVCNEAETFFQHGTMCSILSLDEQERVHVVAAKSLPTAYNLALENQKIGPKTGSCGTAMYRKEAVIVDDIEQDPLWEDYRELARANGLRACWSTPIITGEGKVLGSFATYFPMTAKPREVDIDFINRLVPLISLAILYSQNKEETLRLAYIDPTTELPNHHFFVNELQDLMNEKEEGFLAIIEPAEFAHIVDVFGRDAGDELMKQLALRVQRKCRRADDFLARFTNTSLILAGLNDFDEIEAYISLVFQTTQDPFMVADSEVFITLKIGVTPFKGNALVKEEIIRLADMALSDSKKKSGNSLSFFALEQDSGTKREMLLTTLLSQAILRNELDVHFQPKVWLETGEIYGFEALCRWKSVELGDVSPATFIPLAEATGKIRSLELHVLDKVIAWLKKRQDNHQKLYQVAINISTDHFYHPQFLSDIMQRMTECAIDPKWIRIEITESIGMVDFDHAIQLISELRKAGFETSIDDFGMGYSSLSYLQQFQVDELKIDRSFVLDSANAGTLAIIRTIVQLAENLQLQSIAEGIETEEQLQTLRSINCKHGQGFYFYKPMPLSEIDALVNKGQQMNSQLSID
ncbi:EAL domain-containing protein [Paenisporosarcina cavernae]|uniref:Phosphodiesterase n=1 Tax=Paenisporosarcina cavernae TaxID=2320858 RepID=A0A385YQ16_9BACL|nr:EAL domain-containing protein [Paenisporosarcina cavernae]AYC28825.1 phosphodiesterase [Paenisporosarcina cavernae]